MADKKSSGVLIMSKDDYFRALDAAMNVGYIYCERGMNVQAARAQFETDIAIMKAQNHGGSRKPFA